MDRYMYGPCKSRWLGDFVDREVGASILSTRLETAR